MDLPDDPAVLREYFKMAGEFIAWADEHLAHNKRISQLVADLEADPTSHSPAAKSAYFTAWYAHRARPMPHAELVARFAPSLADGRTPAGNPPEFFRAERDEMVEYRRRVEAKLEALAAGRGDEWLEGSRGNLNRALGKSRGYRDYLERQEKAGKIELRRLGYDRFAIRIIDNPELDRRVRGDLARHSGGG